MLQKKNSLHMDQFLVLLKEYHRRILVMIADEENLLNNIEKLELFSVED